MRDAIKHAVETLRSLENALGFCARSEKLNRLANEIGASNDVDEIHRLAELIIGEL